MNNKKYPIIPTKKIKISPTKNIVTRTNKNTFRCSFKLHDIIHVNIDYSNLGFTISTGTLCALRNQVPDSSISILRIFIYPNDVER